MHINFNSIPITNTRTWANTIGVQAYSTSTSTTSINNGWWNIGDSETITAIDDWIKQYNRSLSFEIKNPFEDEQDKPVEIDKKTIDELL